MAGIEPPFLVKICGITKVADARAALTSGANALGFNFYPRSPRYISPSLAREIVQSLSGEYLKVGVFVNASSEELSATAEAIPLDVLQLHGDRSALLDGYRIWRSVCGDGPAPEPDARIEAYLLDTATPEFGGSGRTFDWRQARNFPYRAIVAGGLDEGNVSAAIAALHPWGVDCCSRIESQPGKKDVLRMQAFLRAALDASESLRSQEIGYL